MLRVLLFGTIFITLTIFSSLVLAQHGCCSWHGGVNGCNRGNGHLICNDGTDSPSCMCFKLSSLEILSKYSRLVNSSNTPQHSSKQNQ